MNKYPNKPSGAESLERQSPSTRPLGPLNFKLMAVSGLIIVVGFLLMLGSGNDTGTFNPEIFSTRRVVVGPTIAFLGFIFMGVAIMWNSTKKPSIFKRVFMIWGNSKKTSDK